MPFLLCIVYLFDKNKSTSPVIRKLNDLFTCEIIGQSCQCKTVCNFCLYSHMGVKTEEEVTKFTWAS